MTPTSRKRVVKVKAWARICLDGCGFIETTDVRVKTRRGEVSIPCTITYSLPKRTGRKGV